MLNIHTYICDIESEWWGDIITWLEKNDTGQQGCAGLSIFQQGGAGRGWKSAGRGGAKNRVNQRIQRFDKSAYIVIEIFIIVPFGVFN